MRLPLADGTVLAGKYVITSPYRRVLSQNLYFALDKESGRELVLNEYLPGYCERGGDYALAAAPGMETNLERDIESISQDTNLILGCDANERFNIEDHFRENGTVYIVSVPIPYTPLMDEGAYKRGSGLRGVRLGHKLINFAYECQEAGISTIPNKFNLMVGGSDDSGMADYKLIYTSAYDMEGISANQQLGYIIYWLLFGKNYYPDDKPEKLTDRKDEKELITLIVSSINDEGDSDFTEFRDKISDILRGMTPVQRYEASPEEIKSARRLVIIIIAIVLAVVTAAAFIIAGNILP
jgi:hypothetical protein